MRRPCASLPAPERAREAAPSRRRPTAAAAIVVAGVLLLGAGSRASAAGPAIEVHVTGCADVDGREVERLLAIELAFVVAQVTAQRAAQAPIAVALSCAGPRLLMTAQDPILNRPLAREVVLGPPEAGRDRTIALLVSQLFLTSWAEGLLARPNAATTGATTTTGATATTASIAPPQAPPSPTVVVSAGEAERRPARFELHAESGVRLRDRSSPVLGEQVSFGLAFPLGRLRALAQLDVEHGSTDRAAGVVSWTLAAAGLGTGWRSRRHGVVALDSSALLSLGFADVHGAAGAAATTGSTVTGVVGGVALGAGPVLFWGSARLALEVELGATFPTATARVSGERDVALGGLWAGAGLSVGVGWAAR
jgi:hypothetical protein